MRTVGQVVLALLLVGHTVATYAQPSSRTLVAVFAHADDETSVAPVLARYAREGVRVHLIIATDGAQGGSNTSVSRGVELAKVRSEEARCAAAALGIQPPILLSFPDGALGHYVADTSLLFRLTQRVHEELQRLRPDAVITWGPDGAVGHPDHRLVGNLVTQLVRAGAPGVPERLFYAHIPVERIRLMNPARGEPLFLIPKAKHLSARLSFTAADFEAARRSMSCHKTNAPASMFVWLAGAMMVVSLAIVAVGTWWLILFNRPSVKAQFTSPGASQPARQRLPIRIHVMAWMLVCSVMTIPVVLFSSAPLPVFLFGYELTGALAPAVLVVQSLVAVTAGIGLLRRYPRAHALAVGFTVFGLINGFAIAAWPGGFRRVLASYRPASEPQVLPLEFFDSMMTFMMSVSVIVSVLLLALLVSARAAYLRACSAPAAA